MRADGTVLAAVAALVAVFAQEGAQAASLSRLTCKGQPSGAKSISPEATTDGGGGQLPEGIVRIISARLRISDPVADGLMVFKSDLTRPEAYGAGLPNGYSGGGSRNPSGPWEGLMWPFRDFADGYVTRPVGGPLGNDIGTIMQTGPGDFVVDGIFGEMAFDTNNPASYMRGFPGNGASDFTRYFAVDLLSTSRLERDVMVVLENVEVQVLLRDPRSGEFSLENQRAPDVGLSVHIPAPTSGLLLMGLLPLAARRRR
jgi:hypothetical protein